jgi:hypothetical protein
MCSISCLLGGLLKMAIGLLAEIVFDRLLTKAVDAAFEKLYEMWRRRKAARGEPSPGDTSTGF